MLHYQHHALYAAFDRFPSPKGAATHIKHMLEVLFKQCSGGLLYTLGGPGLPVYQHEGQVEVVRFAEPATTLWQRAAGWSAGLHALLQQQTQLQLCHFRDPWGGVPILEQPHRSYRTVYEINGLPSCELPFHLPNLAPAQIAQLRTLEQRCWNAADVVLSPSQTMRSLLIQLGAPAERITVIPNGATIPAPVQRPHTAPPHYVLYFGALQPWQGIDVLLKAWQQLRDWPELQLVICSANSEKRARPYQRLAQRLGCAARVQWLFELSQAELMPWVQHALFSVAPLTQSTRNLDQGCCPLKVLESMAAGVPVLASDLPVVRELITHAANGWLVRPDRPAALARGMRILLEYPQQRQQLGQQAQQTIATQWTWQQSQQRLADCYTQLLLSARRSS